MYTRQEIYQRKSKSFDII